MLQQLVGNAIVRMMAMAIVTVAVSIMLLVVMLLTMLLTMIPVVLVIGCFFSLAMMCKGSEESPRAAR